METSTSFKPKDNLTKQELIDFLKEIIQYIQELPNDYSYSSNGLFIMSKPIENKIDPQKIEDSFFDAACHATDK